MRLERLRSALPAKPRVLTVVTVAVLIACSGIITAPDGPPDTRPRSLRMTPGRLDLKIGEKKQVLAALFDAAGDSAEVDKETPLKFSSADTAIASVDDAGMVNGAGVGTTTIRATYANLTLSIPVEVLAIPKIVVIAGTGQAAEQGDSLADSLAFSSLDDHGLAQTGVAIDVAVTTGGGQLSASTIVTDANGVARVRWTLGLAVGEQSVTASRSGLEPVVITATATKGTRPKRVQLIAGRPVLSGPGDTTQLSALAFNVVDDTLAGAPIAWRSANAAVLTVSGAGLVTAVSAGDAYVFANAGLASDSVLLTVTPPPPPPLGKLSLGADLQHPASLQQARVVTLPADAPAPVALTVRSLEPAVVLVSSSAPAAGTASATVNAAAGDRTVAWQLHGIEDKAGSSASIVVEAPGYAPDTMVVTLVRPAFTLESLGPLSVPATGGADPALVMTVGSTVGGGFIAMPVRAGGVSPSFTLSSETPSVAQLRIVAGADIVGADQGPAASVNFGIPVGSSSTSRSTPNIVAARSGTSGTTTIRATGPADYDGQVTALQFTVNAVAVPVIAGLPASVNFTTVQGAASPAAITIPITNGGGQTLSGLSVGVVFNAPASDWLTATLDVTTAPATLTLTPSTGTLPEGSFTADITVSSTVNGVAPVTMRVFIDVTTSPSGPLPKLSLGPDNAFAHPAGLQQPKTITVDSNVATPVVVTLRALTPGTVFVAGSTANPGAESNTFTIAAGTREVVYHVSAPLDARGASVQLVAEAAGYESDTVVVNVVTPYFQLKPAGATTVSASDGTDPVLVLSVGWRNAGGDFTPMGVRAGDAAPQFTLTSAVPAVATVQVVHSATVTPDAGPAAVVSFELKSPASATADGSTSGEPANLRVVRSGAEGTVRITATGPAEYDAVEKFVDYTLVPAAALPKLSLGADTTHPASLQAQYNVTVPTATAAPVSVTLRSLRAGFLLVSASATTAGGADAVVQLPAGATQVAYYLQGIKDQWDETVLVVAEAPGYLPDTMSVDVVDARISLDAIGATTLDAIGGSDPSFIVSVGMLHNGVFTPMAVSAGGAASEITVRSEDETRAKIRFVAGAGLTGANQGPSTEVVFSMEPGTSATLPANLVLVRTGLGGDVTVRATTPGFFFANNVTYTLTGDAPEIGSSESVLNFNALAGGASPAAFPVAITNSGTGALPGLAAEVSYGAGASDWLSASFDVTTAPATLTVTPQTGMLAAGNYTAKITITSTAPGVIPRVIDVSLAVTPGAALPKLSLGADVTHPAWLQDERLISVPTNVAAPVPVTLRALTDNGVLVSGSLTNPGSSSNTFTIQPGTHEASYRLSAHENAVGHVVTLVAEADGYEPDTMIVTVNTPRYTMTSVGPTTVPAEGGAEPAVVLTIGGMVNGVFKPMPVRATDNQPLFTVRTSNDAIATVEFVSSPSLRGSDQGPQENVSFGYRDGVSATATGPAPPANLQVIRAGVGGTVDILATGPEEFLELVQSVQFTIQPPAPKSLSLALLGTPVIGVDNDATIRVTLSAPAPVGGVNITLASSNPSIAAVMLPSTEQVPAGASTIEFGVSGFLSGTVTLTASGPGYTNGTLDVTVSTNTISVPLTLNVPFTHSASLPITLTQPAPAGGALITITSTNPSIVSVATPTVLIPAGTLSGNAQLNGLVLGEAVVTATGPNLATGASVARVTAALDILEGSVSFNAGFNTVSLTTRLLSGGAVFAAPVGGIPISFTSRSPACVAAPANASIAAGLNTATVTADYGGTAPTPCSTWLVVSSPSFEMDSVFIQVNPPPSTSLSIVQNLAAGLARVSTMFLGVASPPGGTSITITSSDPSRLRVAASPTDEPATSAILFVPPGASSVNFTLSAIEGTTGTAEITAVVPKYSAPTPFTVSIDPLGLESSQSASLTALAGDGSGSAVLGSLNAAGPAQNVFNETVIRTGGPTISVTLESSNPAAVLLVVDGVAAAQHVVTLGPGQSRVNYGVRPVAPGISTITSSSPSAPSPVRAGYPATVTVLQPTTSFGVVANIGAGLARDATFFLGSPAPAGGTVVTLTSSDPTRLLLSPNTSTVGATSIDITIPAGASSLNFSYAGVEGNPGSAQIIGAVQGGLFGNPTPANISVDVLGLEVAYATNLVVLAGDGSGSAFLGSLSAAGPGQSVFNEAVIRAGGPTIGVTIESTTPTAVQVVIGGVAAGQHVANIGPGQSRVNFSVRAVSGGTSTVTAVSPNATAPVRANYPATINVSQPTTAFAVTDNIGAGLAREATFFLGAPAPIGGVTITLSSSDPTRLVLAPNLSTVGTASIDVTIPAGSSSTNFTFAGIEGNPGTAQLTAVVQGGAFSNPTPVSVTINPIGIETSGQTGFTTLGGDGTRDVSVGSIGVSGGGTVVFNQSAIRAGGASITITLTSTTPTVAVPVVGGVAGSPATVTIEPGQSRVSYGVRPLVAGTTTITATSPSAETPARAGYPATISVTAPAITASVGDRVGAGLAMPATAFLGVAAPVGGTTLTFTSSDPTRILLAKDLTSAGASQISIPVAQGGTSTNFVIMGLEDVTGNPTVTIQAPGYTDGTASVSVQPIGVQYSIAGGAFTTLSPDMGGTLSIGVLTGVDGNRFMALVQPIRFGGVSRTVTMTSSNPAVILPVAGGVATQSATVTLQPGEGSVSVPIRPIGAGTAIISPSGVGLLLADAPNNPPSVTVTTPTQTLSVSTFSQGAGLAQTATLFLGAAVPAGGRTLTLTSTNPSRLLLAPNATTAASNQLTFNLTQGATSLGVVFVGLEGVTGSAPVTASISGYRDTTFTFTVVQPAVVLDGPAATRTVTQGDVGFAAQVGVLVGGSIQVQTVRFDAPAPLTVTLTSSAPSIGTVVVGGTAGSPNSIEILPGNSSSAFNGAMFRPLSSGNTTISASIPGFIQHGNAIRTVTVTP